MRPGDWFLRSLIIIVLAGIVFGVFYTAKTYIDDCNNNHGRVVRELSGNYSCILDSNSP